MDQANVGPPRSVLLVDDEDTILALLTAALKRSGTQDVVGCISGEDALKMLGERSFDVLVTDKSLPGIDGHEVIDHARKLHPHIGIVMITAKGTLESSTRGFRQRIDYYLLKPFDDIDDFIDVVHASYRMHAHIRRLEEARAELDALLGKSKR